MNERDLSLIKALGEEIGEVLAEMRDSFSRSLKAQSEACDEKFTQLLKQIEDISPAPAPDISALVKAVITELPPPVPPELPDIPQMVSEAVAALPPAQDGKSVTVDDVRPLLQELVKAAVAELPPPIPGKPGEDGRDALALELLPCIDEEKSYPRGSYATHNGGLWRAYEKTCGLRGWECIVDGVAGVDVSMDGQRNFTVSVNRASGASEKKAFDIPVMVYRGVFKSGDEYLPGDTVTWGGSLWHCDTATADKPGETGSKGWTLAAKRGRDGRDKT